MFKYKELETDVLSELRLKVYDSDILRDYLDIEDIYIYSPREDEVKGKERIVKMTPVDVIPREYYGGVSTADELSIQVDVWERNKHEAVILSNRIRRSLEGLRFRHESTVYDGIDNIGNVRVTRIYKGVFYKLDHPKNM